MPGKGANVRVKYRRFRALIIGRANAGKTTVLKAVCNSTEDPRIYDSDRNKLDASIIAPTAERGEHDIHNELVFSSNEGFVFHDSRGFEAGSDVELETTKAFITERANATSLDQQLHAIWYCIPVDNARLLTAAELDFFDSCDPRGVPVIAVFTKFDSRDSMAFSELRLLSSDLPFEEAKQRAQQAAEEKFNKEELPRIRSRKFPPLRVIFLRDMDKEGMGCQNLIEQTTGALDNDALKVLLVSVQQTNLKLCVRYALKGLPLPSSVQGRSSEDVTVQAAVYHILPWFPHVWFDAKYEEVR